MPTSASACVTDTPASLGFRWPAEWEPHRATWLAWPHNRETWPGRLDAAEEAVARIVRALEGREQVVITVCDAAVEDRARGCLIAAGLDPERRGLRFAAIPSNDAWIRDHGPLFVVRGAGAARERAVVDFRFNAWGGKYPPWDEDDAVPRRIAEEQGLRRFAREEVLEGGSIDGNGLGAVLTTESCLLHPNRDGAGGGGRTREQMERLLCDALGARQVLWLYAGIRGDDTDGHVDDVARFVAPARVVTAVEENSADANYTPLQENLRRLRTLRDQDGKLLEVVPLPMPPALVIDGLRRPASYANFYLANGVALVPSFGVSTDERARSILAECLEGRELVSIPCQDLVVGLGALHCMTQQEPL